MSVPLALTFRWMHFADATKAMNPSSQFLVSKNMTGYHFGTSQTRFDAKVWAEWVGPVGLGLYRSAHYRVIGLVWCRLMVPQ